MEMTQQYTLNPEKNVCLSNIFKVIWHELKNRVKMENKNKPSKKSSRCILRRTKKFHPHTNIQFQKQDITWTNHAKYIGVTLDQQQKSINLYQKSIEKLRQ